MHAASAKRHGSPGALLKRHDSPSGSAKGYNAGVASTAHTDEMIKAAFGFLIEELGFELTDSRCHQRGAGDSQGLPGFWDYAYSLAEIGRFLDLGEEEVQAMLDDWDQL